MDMESIIAQPAVVNSLRPRQNERHFVDDIFKCIFRNENVWILIKISLKFVPKGPINNFPTLVQIMALRRPGDKPLPEPMMVGLPTHICDARPQWGNSLVVGWSWYNVKWQQTRAFYYPMPLFGLWVLSLPASVCASVCPCVCVIITYLSAR